MPRFKLWCEPCQTLTLVTWPRRQVPAPICPICHGPRDYDVNVSAKLVDVLDTGTMTHKVEQLQDVEKLHRDRAEQYEGKKDDSTTVKLKP
jgi:hypothetical protein